MAADGGFDGARLGFRLPPDQRLIDAREVMGGKELGQGLMGPVVLGYDHDARGVLVEAVDDARPADTADARETVAAMGQQGIH